MSDTLLRTVRTIAVFILILVILKITIIRNENNLYAQTVKANSSLYLTTDNRLDILHQGTTLAIPIQANNYDGYEDPTFKISGDGYADNWVGTETWVITGWIFSGIELPEDSVILDAYIHFRGFGNGGTATTRIHGFAENNAGPFLPDGSNKPSTRPTTTNFVDWPNTWPYQWQWFQTPNLSAVIQELINRPGWNSGNSIGFKVSNSNGTGTNWAVADFAQGAYFGGSGQHSVTLYITYAPASPSIVSEARLDIGMPYNNSRGCASPYIGCGGPFHGFYAGVCTDLTLDAYNSGISFSIQQALVQDHLANPGRYRYGTARNAEDMRRYFANNQSFLPHNQSYEPGDIGFFDWNGDGLTNHVLIISTVDSNGRPLSMVDASGVIPGINPSGVAFEHNWSAYYDQHTQGHARLSPTFLSTGTPAGETAQHLRVTVTSADVSLGLFDANGKSVSAAYDENLIALNIEAAIPYIPGGSYADLDAQKVITVAQPLTNSDQYFATLDAQVDTTFSLLVETLQNGAVTAAQTYTHTVEEGGTYYASLNLSAPGGIITFTAESPTAAPILSIPEELSLTALVGEMAEVAFAISEVGGQQMVDNAVLTASDLTTQYGIQIPAGQLVINPASFDVAAGDSQQITMQIDLAQLSPGIYHGSLLLMAQNSHPVMIRVVLDVQYYQLYLPVTMRD